MAPGDPILALAGESGDAEYYAFMREKFGLDDSMPEQLARFASNAIRGDLGVSYTQGRPALTIIGERLGATLLLAGSALVISTIVGVLAGVIAARYAGGVRDAAITTVTLSLYAAPVFWIGQLALLFFALRLGWFPTNGMTSPSPPDTAFGQFLDLLHHLALPALVLASQQVASVSRLTRIGLVEELSTDHVRTARAKGLRESTVVWRHALRRALGPVFTVIGARIGYLFSGAVVVEIVFGWPGIGRLMLSAVQTRDGPILLGIFLLVSTAVVVANLITDLAYGTVDPRIRYR
ncbi:MAG: ABC transporter permease [Actinobacteria bacterium]|nr:MAG: ABC transporter permease [Actinomycetota bacterium]REK38684.1 MAG: ABC transporter permease [Actinomycetota bacterium]